jgi:hypothetical protein
MTGIDISPTACRVMAKRLRDVCALPESEPLWRAGRGFVVRDLPWTPFWTAVASAARHRFRTRGKSPDGIASSCARKRRRRSRSAGALQDVSSSAAPRKQQEGELGLKERWYPIQVKQKDKAGRPDIDAFEAMMMREACEKGFFVSFDYSSDALQEIESFFKRSHKVIVALTVQEILDEHIAKKLV